MCWKHEWAFAIIHLDEAINHVETAQSKIHARLVRNEETLQKLSKNPKYNSPGTLAPVEALIEKNLTAEVKCEQIVEGFRKTQAQLSRMIQVYGIRHSRKEALS
jgi:hypothetical protein